MQHDDYAYQIVNWVVSGASETDYRQERRRQAAHTGEGRREVEDRPEEDKFCMPRA
jgi:hypothetical protein